MVGPNPMNLTTFKHINSISASVFPLTNDLFFPTCVEVFNRATTSISLCTYAAKYYRGKSHNPVNDFFNALRRAAQRGVNIRLLLNGDFSNEPECTNNVFIIRYFKNPNFHAALAGKSTRLHSKLILVDEHITIMGSHNLSLRAHRSNFETSILIDSQPTTREFLNHFERLWKSRVLVLGTIG